MTQIPFKTTDWSSISPTVVPGTTGTATIRERSHGDVRIRMIEYSANYLADHWCRLGHLVFVLSGELINEMEDGTSNVIRTGGSYAVSDGLSSHRSRTIGPVSLLVVDGGFLK